MDLMDGKIGSEGDYDLVWKDGKLRFTIGYDGKGVDSGIYLDLEPSYFMEKLKLAIPGELDDKVIDMIMLAMK